MKEFLLIVLRIVVCAIVLIVASVGYSFYEKEYAVKSGSNQNIELESDLNSELEWDSEFADFIPIDSLKVLEPRLYSWIQQKNPKFDYDEYGILDQGGYTFMFGLSALVHIISNVTIFKGDSLVNEFCPWATLTEDIGSVPLTGEAYLAKCEPMFTSSNNGVRLVDMEVMIDFDDFNKDGLLDFILTYDRSGSMGACMLLAYQKEDGSGFEEKLNGRTIFYNDAEDLIYTHTSADSYGGYTDGYDSKSLEHVYSANWECLDDKNLTFKVERLDLNKMLTHKITLADPESLHWEVISTVMDSLNYLIVH